MDEHERKERMAEVMQEWATDLNEISQDEVTYGSKKEPWWRCGTCGWEWKASPDNRIRGKTGCPNCAGKILTPENCFANVRPDLISWWDTERNGTVTPYDVFPNTHTKYYFVCPNGHSYPRPVYHMTASGGCKYCSRQVAGSDNNIAVTHPELAAQWHPTKNGDKKPEDYLSGANEIVWWRCNRGHSWSTSITKRANRGDGCSRCHNSISLVQARVYAELAFLYDEVQLAPQIAGHEVDVYLPSENIGIEIDGYPWHIRRTDADEKKSNALGRAGLRLIRLRDTRLSKTGDETIAFHSVVTKKNIDSLIRLIGTTSDRAVQYLSQVGYQNSRDFWKVAAERSLLDKKNSLAHKHPAVAREWDYLANYPAIPTQFEAQSNVYASWICPDCGEHYPARISHRTQAGSKCPFCSGRKVTRDRSFAGLHPEALKHWDWQANSVDPHTITPCSNVVCFWKCEHGHTYKATPNQKTAPLRQRGKYRGCGECYRQRGKKKT